MYNEVRINKILMVKNYLNFQELGDKILQMLKKNPHIKYFDIRNCDILHETKCEIDLVILENRDSNSLASLN